jgi:hypothetical protein
MGVSFTVGYEGIEGSNRDAIDCVLYEILAARPKVISSAIRALRETSNAVRTPAPPGRTSNSRLTFACRAA